MGKGFPLFATLTEAPLPSAPVAWFDLNPLQRGPGKVTKAPIRLRQRYAGMGLLHLSQRQFRPRQADRRGGQAGENLSWRDLCGRTPTGLGEVALGDTYSRMPQRRGRHLQGHPRWGGWERNEADSPPLCGRKTRAQLASARETGLRGPITARGLSHWSAVPSTRVPCASAPSARAAWGEPCSL